MKSSHHKTCEDCVDLLYDYLDSNLDPETLKQLTEHLSACPPCVNFLKTYQSCLAMEQGLRDQAVQIPLEMEHRLKSFLRQQLNEA